MAPSSQSRINSIRKLNNIVVSRLTHPRPSVISDKWRHDTSQDWEYLAKNYENLTTALISNETLLRLDLHISSTGYLEDRALCFTEVIEHNNTGFDREVVEDKDGEEDGKEAVTNSEKEASKKWARYKTKRDVARARALLLAAVLGSSAPASASVPMPESSAVMPGLSASASTFVPVPGSSAAVPGSSAALPELSAAGPGSSVAMPESSATVPGLSVFASASVFVPGSSASVLLSTPMLSGSFPLLFPALSSPKTPTPNLATKRRRLDNTISG